MPKTSAKLKAPTTSEDAAEKTRQFKGIRMRKWGKWVSEVRVPNSRKRIWLGSYPTPQRAARAYDFAVYCLRGPKAKLNFPDSVPEIPSAPSLSLEEIQAAAAGYAMGDFQQPCEKDAASFGSENRRCIEGQVIEQHTASLDSFFQENLESSQSTNPNDFSAHDVEPEIFDFLGPKKWGKHSAVDSSDFQSNSSA